MQDRQARTADRPFVTVAVERFNDSKFNSGGLIKQRNEYDGIDPEMHNSSGLLTTDRALDLWRATLKASRQPTINWEASGQHGSNFSDYCNAQVDVLWIFDCLHLKNNPELKAFCRETEE